MAFDPNYFRSMGHGDFQDKIEACYEREKTSPMKRTIQRAKCFGCGKRFEGKLGRTCWQHLALHLQLSKECMPSHIEAIERKRGNDDDEQGGRAT